MQKTCSEWKAAGLLESNKKVQLNLGDDFEDKIIEVECDMTSQGGVGVTIVRKSPLFTIYSEHILRCDFSHTGDFF